MGIERCCVPTCVTRPNLRAALTMMPALGDGQAHGLFDVGVHAGLHGEDHDPGPGVGGGFDHHGVELLFVDHAAEVFVHGPLLAGGTPA